MCPVGCNVDADCPGEPRCSMEQRPDGTYTGLPKCWFDEDAQICVKKCLIPRCIPVNGVKRCELAPPPEGAPGHPYVPCTEQAQCGPPLCGDGVVQGTGVDDDQNGGVAEGCSTDFPQCVVGNQGDAECPEGEIAEFGAGLETCSENGDAHCYRCVPDDAGGMTRINCPTANPYCLDPNAALPVTVPCTANEIVYSETTCMEGGRIRQCARCRTTQDPGGSDVCNVTGTSCAQVPNARACKEPYCVDVNGRRIQGTSCDCSSNYPDPALCLGGYYLPSGQFTSNRPSGCISFVPRGDGTCNCIMAALPGSSPIAPVASLLKGSSLLATSIINNCSTACPNGFAEDHCGPGEACFALMGWNTAVRQCAPADCAGREEECGMTPRVYIQGQPAKEWEICGSGNPPDEPEDPENPDEDPPGQPIGEDGEECDDLNNASNDGCSATCQKEVCGDGITQAKGADGLPNTADDEECDDGNRTPGDGCSDKCKANTCGDGTRDYGEECDDGEDNSDTEPGACRTDCMMPKCNDGVVDDLAPWDEECDCGEEGANFDWEAANEPGSTLQPYCETEVDGKPAVCHIGMCRAYYCGDGFAFNAGVDLESGTADDEMCDNGPFNSDEPAGSGKCVSNAQCPGAVCVEGECKQVNCDGHDDCSGGKCIDGQCKPGGCEDDDDCAGNRECNEKGECVSPINVFGDGHCITNDDCPSGNCHDNGICMAEIEPGEVPETTCRLDCKPVRCGDGIVDEGVGETCDEGEDMMKCNGTPQPACDCAIPSYGSHTTGQTYSYTCCPENQYCDIWGSETCPRDCGVPVIGNCNNGVVDSGEECDVIPTLKQFLYRPNLDGKRTSFVEDNGKWTIVPASVEKKYQTVDHEPSEPNSPDQAWIRSKKQGLAVTYFHLWDVKSSTNNELIINLAARIGVDFTGQGADWKVMRVDMMRASIAGITVADMNSAIVVVEGDEAAHEVRLTLYHATGRQLTLPAVFTSPVPVTGTPNIDIDAIEILGQYASQMDASACVECKIRRCGNGIQEEELDETCDDGNVENNDGCSFECQLEICAVP